MHDWNQATLAILLIFRIIQNLPTIRVLPDYADQLNNSTRNSIFPLQFIFSIENPYKISRFPSLMLNGFPGNFFQPQTPKRIIIERSVSESQIS